MCDAYYLVHLMHEADAISVVLQPMASFTCTRMQLSRGCGMFESVSVLHYSMRIAKR